MPLPLAAQHAIAEDLNVNFDNMEVTAISNAFAAAADNSKTAAIGQYGTVKMVPEVQPLATDATAEEIVTWLNALRTAMVAAGMIELVER